MAKYIYSVVRCVPNPSTGEFVNIGAIAGDPESGDWSLRQLGNERRARSLAGEVELGAAHAFMARLGSEIDTSVDLIESNPAERLDTEWLRQLHHDMRNVVQLSPPTPVVADSAESALDTVFRHMLIDPVAEERGFISKSRVSGDLLAAYDHRLPRSMVRPRVTCYVGDLTHQSVDFAVGDRKIVQIAQGWSFQIGHISTTSLQVKAWGYAMKLLREGAGGRIDVGQGNILTVDGPSVDLRVAIAPPITSSQQYAFEEAEEIFASVDASVAGPEEISERAVQLLSAH